MFRKAARGILVGWEREPVVAFSIGLSVLSLGIALVVPPIRKSMGGRVRNLNSGTEVYVPDNAPLPEGFKAKV